MPNPKYRIKRPISKGILSIEPSPNPNKRVATKESNIQSDSLILC